MKKKLFILFSCLSIGFWLQAQSTTRSHISTAGAESFGASMTLQWTVGEIAATTLVNDKGMLTQGFLQPTIEILNVPRYRFNNDSDMLTTDLEIDIWPSPVTTNLNIQLKKNVPEGVSFNLFDFSGKRILTENIDPNIKTNTLNLGSQIPGEYVLKFSTRDGTHLQSFIIIKI